MHRLTRLLAVTALSLSLGATAVPVAYAQLPRSAPPVAISQVAPQPVSEPDLGATQARLMELLRVTPSLADVVSADPALLGNQEYVARVNPELAQFLQQHPEIGRNPSFYLFSELKGPNQEHYDILEPKRGFEERHHEDTSGARVLNEIIPVIVMVFLTTAVLWLVRLLLDNRRWRKVFTMQNEVHGKLIEKFATSQELQGYMESDAGRRFLEATPIAVEADSQRLPNLVSRVVSTLQIGLVLVLLGAGAFGLRRSVGDLQTTMLVLGMLAMMPGIGLILSAGITWVIGKRLGLIEKPATVDAVATGFELRER